MRQTLLVVSTVLAPLLSGPGVTHAEKIAVPNVGASGVDPGLAQTLGEILMAEISSQSAYEVVGASDIAALLDHEQQRQLMGCEDNVACMAQIGGALGVDLLLTASVGRVGDTFVLNLKLVDTKKVIVLKRVYKTVRGAIDQLIPEVKQSVVELLGAGPLGTAAAASQASQPAGQDPLPTTTQPAPQSSAPTSSASTAAPPPPFTAPVPSSAADEQGGGWGPWAVLAGGGAGALTGGVLSFLAFRIERGATREAAVPDQAIYYEYAFEEQSRARLFGRVGLITGAVGGAALVAGALWLLLRDSDPTDMEAAAWLAPQLIPAGVGVALTGRW